ncbi:hypothetical protein B0A49_07664 [Cryomyces minteri]|uniref:BTB domain-containing protein n=1 Tax=Cryomyces minteri TaxID=331657 RepID=A0A4U0X2I4_9PEZI|nr:hypothetical protein B0A49_07664 [Cryomyces minteri]
MGNPNSRRKAVLPARPKVNQGTPAGPVADLVGNPSTNVDTQATAITGTSVHPSVTHVTIFLVDAAGKPVVTVKNVSAALLVRHSLFARIRLVPTLAATPASAAVIRSTKTLRLPVTSVDGKSLEAILTWMRSKDGASNSSDMALATNAGADFTELVELYRACCMMRVVPHQKNLRQRVLDLITMNPLTAMETKLVYESFPPDEGIISRMIHASAEFSAQIIMSGEAIDIEEDAAFYDYLANVPVLQEAVEKLTDSKIAYLRRQEGIAQHRAEQRAQRERRAQAHAEYLERRVKRDARMAQQEEKRKNCVREHVASLKSGTAIATETDVAAIMGRI